MFLNIKAIWDYYKTRFIWFKKKQPKHNKTNNVEINYLNGYDAIGEKLDEHSTLTVKQPVVVNEKTKSKVSIGLN